MTTDEIVIAEVARTNSPNVFRVTVATFKGVPMVYFKDWYPKDGGYRPSKGGTGIPLRRLPDVCAALQSLLEAQAD